MVNPVYQQDEELLLNPFGSRYLASGEYTDVNSNEFVVQEDTVISVLTGGDVSISENSIDYKASMNLSGVTLKRGALIVAPVGEAFKSITIDSGSIMAYNCVVGGTKPSGSVPLLLDDYPDAAAAYSLRKLRTDYEGAAIEVRKTVGGETFVQDVGFVDGELDTTSLLSFADGEDVFIAKWYDQSTNNNNSNQTQAANQAKIVNVGTLITKNMKPAAALDGISDSYPLNFIINSLSTAFTVASINEIDNTLLNIGGLSNAIGTSRINSNKIGFRGSSQLGINYTYGNQFIFSLVNNPSQTRGYYNSNECLDSEIIRGSAASSNWGSRINDYNTDGTIQELIIYNSDQSANRTAIETNINNYYTIY